MLEEGEYPTRMDEFLGGRTLPRIIHFRRELTFVAIKDK